MLTTAVLIYATFTICNMAPYCCFRTEMYIDEVIQKEQIEN